MLWFAASGFLFAAGSAYAGTEQPTRHDGPGYTEESTETSPARTDVILTDEAPKGAAQDVSDAKSAEAGPQQKTEARPYAVTVDPDHPGGEFPYGG
jgi:hypothetical protein